MARVNVNRGTRVQFIEIHKMMEPVISKGLDGLVQYAEGWSDERISKETGAGIQTVQGTRKDCFGNLRTASSKEENAARIQALELQVSVLAKNFTELALLHSRLCATLHINKIATVKHLAGIVENMNGADHPGVK